MESGSSSPSATPQANGIKMPASEAATDARPVRFTQLEIDLHAGEQKQQEHAKLRDCIDHRLLLFSGGE